MKQTLIIAAIAAATMVSCGPAKQAVSNPVSDAEKVAKSLMSQGYQLTGGMATYTLESLIQRHNDKLNTDQDRYVSVQGTSEGVGMEDLSSAKIVALNDAAAQYATKAGSVIEGGMSFQFGNVDADKRKKLVGAYTQKVESFILPAMKESFSVYRVVGKEYQVLTTCIIDEQLAVKSREKAMKEAFEDLSFDGLALDKINDLVKKIVGKE